MKKERLETRHREKEELHVIVRIETSGKRKKTKDPKFQHREKPTKSALTLEKGGADGGELKRRACRPEIGDGPKREVRACRKGSLVNDGIRKKRERDSKTMDRTQTGFM